MLLTVSCETVQRSIRGHVATKHPKVVDNVPQVPQLEAILPSDPEPLPQRDDAERCGHIVSGRRCVLPVAHESAHVYPPAEVSPRE